MSTLPIDRPGPGENATYYDTYLARVPDGDVLARLAEQNRRLIAGLAGLGEEKAGFRYAPGKWSVKEVVGHLMDAERVFAYRALRFARADLTPLPGFDEDAWMPAARFDARPLAALLEEYAAVRAATLALFRSFDGAALTRIGTANGNPMSVRALAWVLAGHEIHHAGVLRERYGLSLRID